MSKTQEIHEKKELKDIMRKCRCCLRLIIDDRKAIEIDELIREQFYNLTTISLLKVDALTNRICQMCASDLETFSNLRNDLIEKQSNLYNLIGLDLISEQEQDEIVDDYVSEKQEKLDKLALESKYEYEIVETDGNEEMDEELLWEETVEESSDINNDDNTYTYSEEETPTTSVQLKIEKVEGNEISLKRSREEMEQDSSEYYEENLEEFEIIKDESTLSDEMALCDLCNINVLLCQFDLHSELMHKEFTCEKCDKIFPSKILYKIHNHEAHSILMTIKGEKSRRKYHFCCLCDKEYEYKKHLIDHIRSFHKKERNRQCPICMRMFYHRDIKKHIEHVHGEKKVSCTICGKLYSCMENLKLHMRYHDEPKYVCEIAECGKKFHQKILWEHHILKHSNDKQIDCTQCGGTFYTVRDLNRHTQRVHKKVTRKCFGCDLTFYRKDKYREHVIKQHKELSESEKSSVLESIRVLKWNEEP